MNTIYFRYSGGVKQGGRGCCISNHVVLDQATDLRDSIDVDEKKDNISSWVPHPHTGIYYPKGKEQVMKDVPKGAASFQQTYWLRSEEVDRPSAVDYSNHP
ncbi:glutamate racemase [Thalictrum thalictroides]|uniref:Glutamate racemase n=1 Tax=Thalictrum thalictroides TaxID=46969 RepID=A0A7J6UWI2_THATH|nr:glutamate racemase [Thalictrum thalictroides]